mmetsp:Transcript_4848/g.11412  ORF Transcript_4848/g.11412 Transcript_4848/m.11412 type:complete len:97 (+) Transcript_4848:200-490(+)
MADSAEGAMAPSSVYINGYLHKQTRDGRWQKRWFETNGSFLTYYKTKKMEKLLAGVNLEQVGDIVMISRDHPADGKTYSWKEPAQLLARLSCKYRT